MKKFIQEALANYAQFWVAKKVAFDFEIVEGEIKEPKGYSISVFAVVNAKEKLKIFDVVGPDEQKTYEQLVKALLSQGIASLYNLTIRMHEEKKIEQPHPNIKLFPGNRPVKNKIIT